LTATSATNTHTSNIHLNENFSKLKIHQLTRKEMMVIRQDMIIIFIIFPDTIHDKFSKLPYHAPPENTENDNSFCSFIK